MKATKEKIYVDSNTPMEQQIAFLRQSSITFQFNTFEVLKEKLGSEGIEIFKTILRKDYSQVIEKAKGKSFEEIKKVAGITERVFGFQTEQDYTKPDEFQYSITYCPTLEECKRRGIGVDFCTIGEDVHIEELSKSLGEITEPTRMCWGDNKCTIKLKNTFGR